MSVSLGIDPKTPWFGPLRPESTLFIVLALLLIMTAPAYLLMIKVGLENALKAKAEENELLFREMNHRTKNNLAIATSLISMQRDASPSELAPTLDSLEARMGSIALIHELLYKGGIDAMRESSARRYLEDLLGMIERTTPQGRFSFDLQVDDILVDSKRMLLLGLAADEAIVNSIKHAYPDGRRGPIRVRFSALAETPNVLELVVEDDGIGRVSQSSEKGLGITILATLASQLGGSTRFGAASSGGAKFTLTMPR